MRRNPGNALCIATRADVTDYFDTDPSRYFSMAPGVDLDDALSFLRSILEGDLRFAQGVPDQRIRERAGYVGKTSKAGDRLRLELAAARLRVTGLRSASATARAASTTRPCPAVGTP